MITVGKAAKISGLSRTALLYYDSIGLLSPSLRADNGYRLYSECDIDKLKQIISLRSAGIPLKEISEYLLTDEYDISSVLLKRLHDMNTEIESIKKQQEIIIVLLKNNDLKTKRLIDKEAWQNVLKGAGVDRRTALEWHRYFEKHSAQQHHNLLRMLGFSAEEIDHFKDIDAGCDTDEISRALCYRENDTSAEL